jgi:hypothetical protein
MIGRKWLVIMLDQNEQFKVASTREITLSFFFDLDTSSDTPNRNGHKVSLYGTQITKAKFIADPFAE